MSDKPTSKDEAQQVRCAYCKKWIPAAEAVNPEGDDYALFFCGLECHAAWEEEKAREVKEAFEERSGVKRDEP